MNISNKKTILASFLLLVTILCNYGNSDTVYDKSFTREQMQTLFRLTEHFGETIGNEPQKAVFMYQGQAQPFTAIGRQANYFESPFKLMWIASDPEEKLRGAESRTLMLSHITKNSSGRLRSSPFTICSVVVESKGGSVIQSFIGQAGDFYVQMLPVPPSKVAAATRLARRLALRAISVMENTMARFSRGRLQ